MYLLTEARLRGVFLLVIGFSIGIACGLLGRGLWLPALGMLALALTVACCLLALRWEPLEDVETIAERQYALALHRLNKLAASFADAHGTGAKSKALLTAYGQHILEDETLLGYLLACQRPTL